MATRKRRSTARAAVLPARPPLPELRDFLPSVRSLLAGVLAFAIASGAYLAARDTSLFAVRSLEVTGGSPELRAQVREALAGDLGRSLVRVDGADVGRRMAAVPGVRSFTYDRAFPNTLKIALRPEVAALVLRQGADAYLVSSTARVLQRLRQPRRSTLPRLYVPRKVQVTIGGELRGPYASAAAVVAPLRTAPLTARVRFVTSSPEGIDLLLSGGLEVRLGDGGDARLKLAIARRILRVTGAATTRGGYLDVSVPERPVLSEKSQLAG